MSRLANGKLQSYKYDAKNQFLAVIDMESKLPVEEYVYDPSGNILQKTINGETTTYTYDAANQLVNSTSPDGKETKYAYDAAGRMIQEGDKTYEYGWLDKVMRVAENGKTLANFEYHNNGQIAKAIRETDIENFEWDGLALIERNGIKYINEPHAGGGNPVLSIGENTEAIFTDMLGTSLGTLNDNNYSQITKTSFGADSNNANSFFTGKPYIEDLGYAFMFRNYRADIGKWFSQDIFNYPDGYNNFAYCNNNLFSFDIYGATIGVFCDPSAVSGAGHMASVVGNDSSGYNYYSFGSGNDGVSGGASGSGSGSSSTTESGGPYATYDECVAALNATRTNTGRGEYTDSMRVETTPEQDAQAKAYADEHAGDSYWLIG